MQFEYKIVMKFLLNFAWYFIQLGIVHWEQGDGFLQSKS